MRVFISKPFDRWLRKEEVDDDALCKAIAEMDAGLWDADLGGRLFKKRVARKGRGKSSGYRTLIAFKTSDKAFFLYGFAKNEKDNIDEREKRALKKLARSYFDLGSKELRKALEGRALRELECDDEPEEQQDTR